MNPWLSSIVIAYLLGSIPFGYLLVRIFRHEDIRAMGSGNIGATNVARSGAKGLGLATLALDCGKAFLAVEIAKRLAPGSYDVAVGCGGGGGGGAYVPGVVTIQGGQGCGERAGRVPGADAAFGRVHSGGVPGGGGVDAVCFAGVDSGVSESAVFCVVFCAAAERFDDGWVHLDCSTDYWQTLGEYEAVGGGDGEPVWKQEGGGMSRIAVLGAGAWGTAMAIALARRGDHELTLWAHSPALADDLAETGENLPYLPGVYASDGDPGDERSAGGDL